MSIASIASIASSTSVMTGGGLVVRRAAQVMGTVASIHVHAVVDEPATTAAIDAALAELERLEAMFSTFRSTSVVSRINRGELDLLDAPREVIEVLDSCTWLEHASDGAFDCRRPDGSLDPAGFVKGWAAEKAAAILAGRGITNFMFSVGGDLVVHGEHAPGRRWNIAIADPLCTGAAACSVEITGGAVATSGTSERGQHIRMSADATDATDATSLTVDSATSPIVSLTVLGPSLAWADAFATAAFAMGSKGLDWITRFDGYRAIAIDATGALSTSGDFALTQVCVTT